MSESLFDTIKRLDGQIVWLNSQLDESLAGHREKDAEIERLKQALRDTESLHLLQKRREHITASIDPACNLDPRITA
jgi:hypothetical protein